MIHILMAFTLSLGSLLLALPGNLLLNFHLLHSLELLRYIFFLNPCVGLFVYFLIELAYRLILFALLCVQDVLRQVSVQQDALYFTILAEFVQQLLAIIEGTLLALVDHACGF